MAGLESASWLLLLFLLVLLCRFFGFGIFSLTSFFCYFILKPSSFANLATVFSFFPHPHGPLFKSAPHPGHSPLQSSRQMGASGKRSDTSSKRILSVSSSSPSKKVTSISSFVSSFSFWRTLPRSRKFVKRDF